MATARSRPAGAATPIRSETRLIAIDLYDVDFTSLGVAAVAVTDRFPPAVPVAAMRGLAESPLDFSSVCLKRSFGDGHLIC